MRNKEQKIKEIHNQLSQIINDLENQSKASTALHKVEGSLFHQLLQLGRSLLLLYIFFVKKGIEHTKPSGYVNKGHRHRVYRSVFGCITIERKKYWSKGQKVYYPLDKHLSLGSSRYSYLLSDWLADGSVEMDFHHSSGLLGRMLNQDLSAMQASRRTYALSAQVEAYYQQNRDQEQDEEYKADYTHISLGYDGKGIPIRRSQTHRQAESTVTRLAKGKKKEVKKEATLCLSSCFTAKTRTTDQIIGALFNSLSDEHKAPTHKWHEQKHLRAFLSNKPRAIEYGVDHALNRDQSEKPMIILIDGAPSLENTIKQEVQKQGIASRVDAYILDFIHLLEYVWKVANAHLGENSPNREAWVRQQARQLLESKTEQVIEGWQQILDQGQWSNYKRTLLERSIKYLKNRPHMVDYKSYLSKGYPITTGAVESACGHFIKSRMERNAMHWSFDGAQKMLDIRAVKKNSDWSDYIQFFIQHEQQEIYGTAA